MSPQTEEVEEPQSPTVEKERSDDDEAGESHSPIEKEKPDDDDDEGALTKIKSLEKQVSLPREILVVLLICLAQFTTQVGFGSVVGITHVIGDHYGIEDPGILSWLTAGYSLTVGTFILFSGRLGDVFGWKRMMIFGYVWFAIWSIVLGLSWYSNHILFIFARVFQGIGPSICLPNGLALLGALYEPGLRKNLAFAVFGGLAPAGSVVGFTFAGLFALAWWPWTFWSFGIVLAVIAAVGTYAIPDPQPDKPGLQSSSLFDLAKQLDLLGATVGVTALILFNFAWNQAPIVGWASAYIIVTLVLGVVLLPVFIYIEIKLARSPLLPLDVFTSDNAFVLGCVACGWANFGIWFFYLIQILDSIREIPVLLQAAYITPAIISGMVAAVVSGRLLGVLGPAWVMVGALCCFLTGTSLVATLPPYQIYWAQIFVTMVVAPWGMDMSFPSATIVISNSVKKEHQGIGASLVTTTVNYSISLGLGFAGTIQVHVDPSSEAKAALLHAYRCALYLGIGLSALGVCTAVTFLLKCYWRDHKEKQKASQNGDVEGQKR